MIQIGIYVALTWLVCMPLRFWLKGHGHKPLSLLFKAIPTALAAAFAYTGHFGSGATDVYGLYIFIGLCVCTLADVALDVRFEAGGALFFAGHVMYVLALLCFGVLVWWSSLLFLGALAVLWWFGLRYKALVPKPHIMRGILVYSVALAALIALGAPLPFLANSRRAGLAARGVLLFVLSDMTLCHNTATRQPVYKHYLSLGLYYMGQLLLGLSAFSAA